jgi:hypothetical protein
MSFLRGRPPPPLARSEARERQEALAAEQQHPVLRPWQRQRQRRSLRGACARAAVARRPVWVYCSVDHSNTGNTALQAPVLCSSFAGAQQTRHQLSRASSQRLARHATLDIQEFKDQGFGLARAVAANRIRTDLATPICGTRQHMIRSGTSLPIGNRDVRGTDKLIMTATCIHVQLQWLRMRICMPAAQCTCCCEFVPGTDEFRSCACRKDDLEDHHAVRM